MSTNILILIAIVTLWMISSWEAFNRLSWGRLRKIEEENKERAEKVENWLDNKDSYLLVFKFVLFFLIALIAALVSDVFQIYIENVFKFASQDAFLYNILIYFVPALVISFILVVFTEAIIHMLVSKFDIEILSVTIPIIKFLNVTLLFPILLVIRFISKVINKKQSVDEDKPTTEDEIMSLLENDDQDEDDTSLEEDEKQMIKGIFELDDTIVREIMTPRVDVMALPISASIEEAIELFIKTGHSRIPVFHNTVDEISGIILAKDFLNKENIENKLLKDLAHKPIYIPETKSTLILLNELKGSHNHFAVVIDEYGGTAGIITMEDILEEIVGEIHDEHETEEEITPKEEKDGSYIIEARTLLDEVEELFDIKLPEDEDVDTIGGFISAIFGKIPEPDEEICIEDLLKVKVLKADKRRVLTLKITKL
jgi:putative hemolysin